MSRRRPSLPWCRILVATDFSPTARVALRSAEALALRSGAGIVLVHVVELPSTTYAFGTEMLGFPDIRKTWAAEARRRLEATAGRLHQHGVNAVEIDVRIGRAWQEIVASARTHDADLVVLGNSGRSRFDRLLLGSTAENVLRHSPVPVLVTRSRPLRGMNRVLVPVSFDEGSRGAVAFARSRLPHRVELEAYHAVPPISVAEPWFAVPSPSVPEVTRELRAFLREAGAGRMKPRVELADDAASAILRRARAWKADLVLISTHGRRGLSHLLLGSVAEKVARYADRPVLVLPPPGWAEPAAASGEAWEGERPRRTTAPLELPAGKPNPRPLGRKRPGPWTGQAHTPGGVAQRGGAA
ncbi:MAG TPA: universal stress protein [Gemmatimonadota bacterium]|nr:universal stress protein [Gemmatimonadota bacterium]